ncbi:DUF7146 domain-containing protein [Methylobacterium sp. WSM2598]|uniref:DUF7146 domain-containing protein n=1 Tax=Methylobacterium sp. WSM2598 TaxID=398261 RepID=UPI0003627290|nr:CHC2 zinc finger domain-containing protein [Methylobacterium sp. WSM2598]
MRPLAHEDWIADARAVDLVARAKAYAPWLKRAGREWVGRCPVCGGSDRFAIRPGKGPHGVWLCRGSGESGDVIDLVRYAEGCDFPRAVEILTGRPAPGREVENKAERAARRAAQEARAAEIAAKADAEAQASARFREAERRRLYRLWRAALPLAGTPAETYLALRRLTAPPGAHLRCALRHPLFAHGGPKAEVIHEGPALLAAILAPEGRFTGLHATWIDLAAPDGKLRLADPATGEFVPARKARGSIGGGRIELVRHPEPVRLVLGEGIETVLSAWEALRRLRPDFVEGCAFWSGVSLGNIAGRAAGTLAHPRETHVDRAGRARPRRVPNGIPANDPGPAIPIPPSVTELWLCQDGDSDPFATGLAMERAARRFARPGLTVHIAPAPKGQDFNDVLRSAA